MEKWKVIEYYRNILKQESGYIKKNGRVKAALIYPNVYEIAIQNLGFQSVYKYLNEIDGVVCERFTLDYYEDNLSIENQRFIAEFDIIFVSINYEEDIINLIKFLLSQKVQPFSHKRSERFAPIVAGGALTSINPRLLLNIADIQLCGDLMGMCSYLTEPIEQYCEKNLFIEKLKQFPFAVYDSQKRAGVYSVDDSSVPLFSGIKSGKGEFANEILVEMSKGCKYLCRFCTTGYVFRPYRNVYFDKVVEFLSVSEFECKDIGIISAAFGDIPSVKEKVRKINEMGFDISVSSLRADTLDKEMISLLKSCGVRSITIAEETCSDRLKRLIGKEIPFEIIIDKAEMAAAAGIENLKLYYMIGLPSETEEDISLMCERIAMLSDRFRSTQKINYNRIGKIKVSINIFIPKPFTPMQYFGMADKNDIKSKTYIINKALSKIPNLKFEIMSYNNAAIQSFISRGEEYIDSFYQDLIDNQFNIKKSIKGINIDNKVTESYPDNYIFAWEKLLKLYGDYDIIKNGYKKCLSAIMV